MTNVSAASLSFSHSDSPSLFLSPFLSPLSLPLYSPSAYYTATWAVIRRQITWTHFHLPKMMANKYLIKVRESNKNTTRQATTGSKFS